MDRTARKTLLNALIVSLLSCTILNASSLSAMAQVSGSGNFLQRILPDHTNRNGQGGAVIRVAGKANASITVLEEEVRQLTGKIEELNFMILKMQTQIDELRQGAGSPGADAMPPAAGASARPDRQSGKAGQAAALPGGQKAVSGAGAASPENLDSIRFDHEGNAIGSDGNPVVTAGIPAGGNGIADVPRTDNAQELYQVGYQHVLAGDYRAAEAVFRAFQERYPDDPMAGDASFWLGEALYGQGRYHEAAQVYIDVQRKYKGSEHGPENLLKLGMSMAQLDEKDVACATLAEVPKRYKQAAPAILRRVSDERSRIRCP